MEKCRGLGVWGDSGRDPRKMADDRIAEAVALAFVCSDRDWWISGVRRL
jgi:hypothetical protein